MCENEMYKIICEKNGTTIAPLNNAKSIINNSDSAFYIIWFALLVAILSIFGFSFVRSLVNGGFTER